MKTTVKRLLCVGLLAISTVAWAKPKTEIMIEVVSTKPDPVSAGVYNPGTSGSATTTCTVDGQLCNTTATAGTPPSVTPITMYNEYVYAIIPGGRHVTLQCAGFLGIVNCHALRPGNYTAETDGGKTVFLHVHGMPDPRNPNSPGKPGKLRYMIVGSW